ERSAAEPIHRGASRPSIGREAATTADRALREAEGRLRPRSGLRPVRGQEGQVPRRTPAEEDGPAVPGVPGAEGARAAGSGPAAPPREGQGAQAGSGAADAKTPAGAAA